LEQIVRRKTSEVGVHRQSIYRLKEAIYWLKELKVKEEEE
jgi:hypothetical protein